VIEDPTVLPDPSVLPDGTGRHGNRPATSKRPRRLWRWVSVGALVLIGLGIAGYFVYLQPGVPASKRSAKLAAAGSTAQQAGDNTTALADYLAALKISPGDANSAYNIAVIYQQAGNSQAALQYYQNALAIAPSFTSAMFNEAILVTASEPATAIALYQKIIALAPNAASTYFNLGLLLVQQGNTTEGNADIAKAVKLLPSLATRVPKASASPNASSSPSSSASPSASGSPTASPSASSS